MDQKAIQTIYAYHYRRFREIWDSITVLSDEDFLQEIPYSHGSLRNQMVHVIDDDISWFSVLQEVPRPAVLNPADFPTRASVRTKYDEVEVANLEFISQVDSAFLEKRFHWHPEALDAPQSVTGWQVLLHVVNHGTDHRAQILRQLHDLGAPSFDQDLMGYWVQSGITSAANKQ